MTLATPAWRNIALTPTHEQKLLAVTVKIDPKEHWKCSGVAVTSMFVRTQRQGRCVHSEGCTFPSLSWASWRCLRLPCFTSIRGCHGLESWVCTFVTALWLPWAFTASTVSVLTLTPVREVLFLTDLAAHKWQACQEIQSCFLCPAAAAPAN